jgi:hypothetical protein
MGEGADVVVCTTGPSPAGSHARPPPALAALGLAEVARREGRTLEAADAVEAAAADAKARDATWLKAQAVCGLHIAAPFRAHAAWQDLRPRLPAGTAQLSDLVFGDPRVLWTITF